VTAKEKLKKVFVRLFLTVPKNQQDEPTDETETPNDTTINEEEEESEFVP
jgi:hypothetical protein